MILKKISIQKTEIIIKKQKLISKNIIFKFINETQMDLPLQFVQLMIT